MSVSFDYTRNDFEAVAHHTLQTAKKLGARACAVEVSESNGLSVSSRNGAVETVEHNRDKSLSVSVYVGKLAQRSAALPAPRIFPNRRLPARFRRHTTLRVTRRPIHVLVCRRKNICINRKRAMRIWIYTTRGI